ACKRRDVHRRYVIVAFFFFSSRRRHTRSLRDWSSDVCSSDLIPLPSWSESPTATRHRKSLRESAPKSSAPSCFAPVPCERARQSDKSARGLPPIRQLRPMLLTMISLLPSYPALKNSVSLNS